MLRKSIICLLLAAVTSTLYLSAIPTEAKTDVISLLRASIHETENWDDTCSDTTLELSQEDAWRLMKIAVAEGESEGVKGQYLIMRVIINRLYSDDYPDSIAEIISQPHQFQTYSSGTYETAVPNTDSHLALAMLESNKEPDTDVVAFETVSNGEVLLKWFDMKFSYLNHNFYQKKED